MKGVQFKSDRGVGSAMQAVKVYNRREVDELIFLDVSATHSGRPPDFAQIDELADECFMPMTVGGGVSSVKHVQDLLAVGADKISLNSAAIDNPQLIDDAARMFGRQCVVISIDVRREAGGDWRVYSHCGSRPTSYDPVDWARTAEGRGAGEILLTSIDRDGTMTGYDTEITRRVCDAVQIPVIASGGAGSAQHFADVFSHARGGGKADAALAASIFHFGITDSRALKAEIAKSGVEVRLPC